MNRFLPFLFLVLLHFGVQAAPDPVYIGFDGEYSLKNSTSAQVIEMGLQVAIDEVNARGGVLGGRPLALLTRDNRSVPARGVENIAQFAEVKDLVAVVGGRFSPVILSELPVIHEKKMILMDAWGSADGVTEHDFNPSYSFRVSLKDSHAMPTLLDYARRQGANKVALLVPQTGWGRSNHEASQEYIAAHPELKLAGFAWYHWGDDSERLAAAYTKLKDSGAQTLILVANDIEGSKLLRHMASLPESQRLPVISHWGITGGRFIDACGGALEQVDFTFIQTFSLFRADPDKVASVMARVRQRYGIEQIEKVDSPVGFGHAYDIVHLLVMAIEQAGTTERPKVRDALEQLGEYDGLVRRYRRPFTETSHDALQPEDVFMARFDADGVIRPVEP